MREAERKSNPPQRILPWTILALILSGCVSSDDSFSGRVVGVSDGDTVRVLTAGQEVKIRLYGIDCPEYRQAFGTQAKKFTSTLAFGKTVKVLSKGKDQYGRVIGVVLLPDGKNLNHEIVGNGFGWWYEHYAAKETRLKALQSMAKKKQLGLWRDKNPEPPWEFRRRNRK